MTFGWNQVSAPVEEDVAAEMVRRYLASGGTELDTARIYAGGKTEDILGRVLVRVPETKGVKIATKVHPSAPGGLSPAGIRGQLQTSLSALGLDRVDTLYLHQPDPQHSLSDSLECVHALVLEGKVGALGLSNYSALETERCAKLCVEHGWTSPTVVQALYNPLNRWAEDELLPVLRKYQISLVAYNPLAGGLLTGKHRPGIEVPNGRFKDNENYLPRFYTEANFSAVEKIRDACRAHALGMVAASYTWMLQHSALSAAHGDGLLLGASSVMQLDENLASLSVGAPLPAAVKTAFDNAWGLCREGAFPYWRSYSKDQPDRESLHQGTHVK
eukprot:CAMPEP_0170583730 /NCGR_PEP_ID=MMETSP0224-20130122/8297_1 /TAXON_ID=285029 /ORGANISM="Togula jolla, Strain CCCM 725" /LENGTH=329 /DNA_ID=CAMNT_0010907089 /DNA_START=127 /DNA_END=1116 /DNA_ORIENTATION=+